MGIIGGAIGYFLLKDRDRKFAERLLIVGLVMIAVWWAISFFIQPILLFWLVDFTKTRNEIVSGLAESQIKCAISKLEVKEVKYSSTSTVGNVDVTISYLTGTETLTELKAEVSSKGVTVSSSTISKILPGETRQITISNVNLPPDYVRVRALCGSVSIVGECKAGQTCMSPI